MAAIIDWHGKAILSCKISNSMDSSLVTNILQEALNKYPAPLIFNSDQGSQYTGAEHIKILQQVDAVEFRAFLDSYQKIHSVSESFLEALPQTLVQAYIYFKDILRIFQGY